MSTKRSPGSHAPARILSSRTSQRPTRSVTPQHVSFAPANDVAILILAGGEATRLPGKLGLEVDDLPMLARVYRNLCGEAPGREVVLSCKSTLPPNLDRLVPVRAVVDRWGRRGPLGGLLTTMPRMRSRWVFASAGDAPFVDAAFVATLAARRRAGDEAVVPAHWRDGCRQLEPLAALYDRLAFVREGLPILRSGRGKLQLVIDRLQARIVEVDDVRPFANVNTASDYDIVKNATG